MNGFVAIAGFLLLGGSLAHAGESVCLIHGLARTSKSMAKMESALESAGYEVHNIDYPSTELSVEALAEIVRERVQDLAGDAETVHFVTHSMGGILLRTIQETDPIPNIGRTVMLSPPNRGSEVVDVLGDWKLFEWINGPAGAQLGTSPGSLVSRLGPVDYEVGVITGDRSVNWFLSMIIPGPDDGKVAIGNARVSGMKEFRVVHATHPFIMRKDSVIKLVKSFLRSGSFEPAPESNTSTS